MELRCRARTLADFLGILLPFLLLEWCIGLRRWRPWWVAVCICDKNHVCLSLVLLFLFLLIDKNGTVMFHFLHKLVCSFLVDVVISCLVISQCFEVGSAFDEK